LRKHFNYDNNDWYDDDDDEWSHFQQQLKIISVSCSFQEEYEAQQAKEKELQDLRAEKSEFEKAVQKAREDAYGAAERAHDEAVEVLMETIRAGEAERLALIAENSKLQEDRLKIKAEKEKVRTMP